MVPYTKVFVVNVNRENNYTQDQSLENLRQTNVISIHGSIKIYTCYFDIFHFQYFNVKFYIIVLLIMEWGLQFARFLFQTIIFHIDTVLAEVRFYKCNTHD